MVHPPPGRVASRALLELAEHSRLHWAVNGHQAPEVPEQSSIETRSAPTAHSRRWWRVFASALLGAKRLPEPAGEILDELPGDAARTATARHRPRERLGDELDLGDRELVIAGVAAHHLNILLMRAVVESEPEPEAIRQRDLLLDRFRGVDRGGALVLHHVARHEVAAVGGGVEQHVGRPSLDAALEHRLQRLVARVVAVEGEVVAENEKAVPALLQVGEAARQRADVLA